MKKIFATTALLFMLNCIILKSTAQVPLPVPGIKPKVALGIQALYSMPLGDFKDAYKYGVGGEVFGGIGWGSTLLIATVGITSFSVESGNPEGTLTYTPVRIGLKKFFLLNKLFINADVGIASVKKKAFSESAFTAGGGAGVKLLGLELALYYNTFKVKEFSSSANTLNAKVGYSFTF